MKLKPETKKLLRDSFFDLPWLALALVLVGVAGAAALFLIYAIVMLVILNLFNASMIFIGLLALYGFSIFLNINMGRIAPDGDDTFGDD